MRTRVTLRAVASLAAFSILMAVTATRVEATGTLLVEKSNGSAKTYDHVQILVKDESMALVSKDKKGWLVLGKAACTLVEKIVRCALYDGTLFQFGQKTHIALAEGTLWLNPGKTAEPIARSTMKLAPHGVWGSVHTKKGAHAILSGTADEIQK